MPAIFAPDHSENYKYLLDLYCRAATASDDELIAAIRSECSPDIIRAGKIDNCGNQVAMLGCIIGKAGRRKLAAAAPLIVEYCAWPPHGNDFFVYLVPPALRALKVIGDPSVIPRLREVAKLQPANARCIEATILILRGEMPQRTLSSANNGPLSSDTSITTTLSHRAAIIMEAAWQGLLSTRNVIAWADNVIAAHPEPPKWVIDISLFGVGYCYDCVSLMAEHSSTLTNRRRAQMTVVAFSKNVLTLPQALGILWGIMLDYRLNEEPDAQIDLLDGALDAWIFQEGSEEWLHPEALDDVEKELHHRLLSILDVLLEDAAFVADTLDDCGRLHWRADGLTR